MDRVIGLAITLLFVIIACLIFVLIKRDEEHKEVIGYLKEDIKRAKAETERAKRQSQEDALAHLDDEYLEKLAQKKYELDQEMTCELEKFIDGHSLTNTRNLYDSLAFRVEEERKKLQAIQESERAQKEKLHDHKIEISDSDAADAKALRDFAQKLVRKDIINKLIWTAFYQKPLQDLRKLLKADKVTGIYKITLIGSSKCYIGQAVDIGDRWAQHVKEALGVNSLAYNVNKFYKEMHKSGPENFTFTILQECSKEELDEREKFWIKFYDSVENGFNTKYGG